MQKLIRPGQLIYATGIIALGILCILEKDFIVGRPPAATWAAGIPGKLVWAYVSGSMFILIGTAVLARWYVYRAVLLAAFMILFGSFLSRHLYEMTDWVNAYKSLALAGGCFFMAFSFGKGYQAGAAYDSKLIFPGCIFFSLFFIICGFAHFRFADFIIKDFMPAYIPYPAFWTYFCGICLLAAGVGLLIPAIAKWAAFLSGIMIGGWFLLLHIVRFAMDPANVSDRLGLCESFTFVGMLFVLAGILAGKK